MYHIYMGINELLYLYQYPTNMVAVVINAKLDHFKICNALICNTNIFNAILISLNSFHIFSVSDAKSSYEHF